jgi:hypothetical protein
MVRRIIAGAAVLGALTLGTAGAAGAATTVPSTAPGNGSTTTTQATPSCADLTKLLHRHRVTLEKAPKRLHTARGLENRLRKLGHAGLASRYAKRVHAGYAKKKHVTSHLHKAVRECAGAAGSGKSKSSGSSKASTSSTGSTSSKTSTSTSTSTSSTGG